MASVSANSSESARFIAKAVRHWLLVPIRCDKQNGATDFFAETYENSCDEGVLG